MTTPRKQAGAIAVWLAVSTVLVAMVFGLVVLSSKLADAKRDAEEARNELSLAAETQRLSNASMARSQETIKQLHGEADALQTKLRRALARSPDCSLGADVGGLLRDAVPSDPGAAASREVGAKAADPVVGDRSGAVEVEGRPVSCKAIAVWATRNIAISNENSELFSEAVRQYEIARGAHVGEQ